MGSLWPSATCQTPLPPGKAAMGAWVPPWQLPRSLKQDGEGSSFWLKDLTSNVTSPSLNRQLSQGREAWPPGRTARKKATST